MSLLRILLLLMTLLFTVTVIASEYPTNRFDAIDALEIQNSSDDDDDDDDDDGDDDDNDDDDDDEGSSDR